MDAAVSDTDVISFVFKKDSRGEVYKSLLETRFILVLFMSLAELDRWSLAHHWGERRRAELAVFLDRFTVSFADRALCTAWAQATQSAREAGQPIACADAWIGSDSIALPDSADYA